MFTLRARSCHPDKRFLQRENLMLTAQVEDLAAAITQLKAQLPQPRRTIPPAHLAAELKKLASARDCSLLVTRTNGPTVFWLAAKRFGVEHPTAEPLAAQANASGDWRAAVSELDNVKF